MGKIKITLEEILQGQDFNAFKMAEKFLNDEPLDPITQVIVNAWKDNGGPEGDFDRQGFGLDMAYAIRSLEIALAQGRKGKVK